LLEKLQSDKEDSTRLDLMMGYTIGPEYYNTVHYISLQNNGALMTKAAKGIDCRVRYFGL